MRPGTAAKSRGILPRYGSCGLYWQYTPSQYACRCLFAAVARQERRAPPSAPLRSRRPNAVDAAHMAYLVRGPRPRTRLVAGGRARAGARLRAPLRSAPCRGHVRAAAARSPAVLSLLSALVVWVP
jgi:hypothetical protein